MGSSGLYSNSLGSQTIWCARCLSMLHHTHTYNRNIDKHRVRHMAWVCETIATLHIRLTLICSSSSYMAAALKCLTVQLEYLDRLVVSTHLIKPGCIRVTFGSDPHYYPGQWVIQVSDGDLVAMLMYKPLVCSTWQFSSSFLDWLSSDCITVTSDWLVCTV